MRMPKNAYSGAELNYDAVTVFANFTGTQGSDEIEGTDNDDTIRGLGGNDRLEGEEGNDRIQGGSGNDRVEGDEGQDRLAGGNGDDRLDGDDGNDRLDGGAGDDRVEGHNDNDSLTGGAGNDQFWFDGDDDNDVVNDFTDGDRIRFQLDPGENGPTEFSDLTITDTADGALIDYGRGATILLSGVDAATVTAADFIFG